MKLFFKMIKMNFRIMIYYKWGFLLTLFLVPIQMLVNILLFNTLYAHNNTDYIMGYSVTQMVWYFVCVGFVFQCIWNFTDTRISQRILSGELVVDLLKPISLYKIELSDAVAVLIILFSAGFFELSSC